MLRYLLCIVLFCAAAQAETLEQAIHGYLADPDAEAAKPAAKPAPEQPWDITGGLGVALTDGNSNTLTVAFTLDAKKEWGPWKSTTAVRITYAQADSVETASEWVLIERFERALSEVASVFVDLWLEHDEFESLDYRIQPTAGYKRRLVKKTNFELWGNIGAGFVHNEYRVNPDTEGIGQLGVDWTWQITKQLKYEQVILLYPSLSYGGEGRLVFSAKFTTPISDRIDGSLVITDQYNTMPVAGNKYNDLTVILSLAIKFTKPPEKKA
jgi:putative salt-induced outer membrane protein YdiY